MRHKVLQSLLQKQIKINRNIKRDLQIKDITKNENAYKNNFKNTVIRSGLSEYNSVYILVK